MSDSASADIVLVESFFEAFRASDTERALAMLDEAVVYQNVPFPADRGRAAVARTLARFAKLVPSFDVKMVNIAARDGVVLTERVDILSGPFIQLDLWVCGTFEVRDGRITLWRDYFDLATATAQLLTSPLRKLWALARA